MESFADSSQHVFAELERIDLLIRAQVAFNRRINNEDEQFCGLYISEQQVDELLDHPRGHPLWPIRRPDEFGHIETALARLSEVIERSRTASHNRGIDLRLDYLQRRFDLNRLELDALLVCLAVDLDLRYERLYAYLQDDVTKKRPSVDLVLSLLAPACRERCRSLQYFTPQSPLFRYRLLSVVHDPANPEPTLLAQSLKVDTRITQYLLGSDEIDARIQECTVRTQPKQRLDELPLEQAVKQGLSRLARSEWAAKGAVLHLSGPYGVGKQQAGGALCREQGLRLLTVDCAVLTEQDSDDFNIALHLIHRETVLQRAALLWQGFDVLMEDRHRARLQLFIRRLADSAGFNILTGERPWQPREGLGGFRFIQVRLDRLASVHRRKAWDEALVTLDSTDAELDVEALTDRFRLTTGQIRDAVATADNLARWRKPDVPVVTRQDLYEACRLNSNQRLANLAHKITPVYRWADIVLPPDRLEQLREICDYVKYRDRVYGDWGFGRKLSHGKGLALLFAGPSGTGKTMAADIIASELGLDLYKVDLSTVVSKYIGETEKNLSKIFDEAETSNAVLFFDEADALFGKRSEVKDSHDRYANIEIGYLLQRMEEYEGVVILATNFRKNMDEAFVRRLHFTVDFPFPNEEDRCRIWEHIWPAETPLDSTLDIDVLARRFEISGGNIRNIALAAAFMAAGQGGVVGMSELIRATQREYQKMGKVITESEFQELKEGTLIQLRGHR